MPKAAPIRSLEQKSAKRTSEKLKATHVRERQTEKKNKQLTSIQRQQKAKAVVSALRKSADQVPGHRKVTKMIEQNRGLVKHRKRSEKHARSKIRTRFDKAIKKHNKLHKTKVRGTKLPTVESYDGEASGINIRAVRSINLRE